MSMIPVFMINDIGGVVYVCKNEICLLFSDHTEYTIEVNTKKLLKLVVARSSDEWETNKFLIEPFFICSETGALFVLIFIKDTKCDLDTAMVFRSDLIEVLTQVECFV